MTVSEVAYSPDNDKVQLLILPAEKFIWPQEQETFVPLDGEHSSLLAPRLEIKGSGNLWHVYGWPIITAAAGRGLVREDPMSLTRWYKFTYTEVDSNSTVLLHGFLVTYSR